jgi:phospholipid-binding lipoprotein MlaA
VERLAALVACLCLLVAPMAALAALPPHVVHRIQLAAQESRSLDQRDMAMARMLQSGELATLVARHSGRHASTAMSEAVVGSISEYPSLAGEIVATAVAAAPGLRDSIVSDSIKAFPAFAPAIAASGGGYAAAPPLGYIVPSPTYYPQTTTYYGQAPAPAYGYEQPAQPAYVQQAMVIGAPDVDDAFAGGSVGVGEGIYDPFESVNRGIFYVNDAFDSFVFRPLAIGYRFITTEGIRHSMRNFFLNLDSPVVLANDLLQLEIGDAGVTTTRFVINSTIGVLGLFDFAEGFGYPRHHADFGQTLYSYGAEPGVYLVLPLLGPSTARDGVGTAVDLVFDPLFWLLEPLPGLGVTVADGVTVRETLIEPVDDLKASSVDFYSALRSAYYQDRAVELRKGQPADTSELDDLFEAME